MVSSFSQSGRCERADWCLIRGLPDGDAWSTENPANRRDSLGDRLDSHRHVDEHTDVAVRSFANRDGDRPSDLASNRLHHRGGQAGTARLLDLIWTDAGVVRHGAVLLKGLLLTMGHRRLAQPHLLHRAHHAGAAVCAGVACLARLEGPHQRRQEVSGMVNSIWSLNEKILINLIQ